MNDRDEPDMAEGATTGARRTDQRFRRSAEALRANLRKRKDQQQEKRAIPAPDGPEPEAGS